MANLESDSPCLSLSAYVGQEAIKQALLPLIEEVKRYSRPLPHLLLCGSPEMGKETLAHAIAYELQTPIRPISAKGVRLA